jgi:hypothetical protein
MSKSDIVERLRKYDLHEAAEEIERLRAALTGVVEAARFSRVCPARCRRQAASAALTQGTQGFDRNGLDC